MFSDISYDVTVPVPDLERHYVSNDQDISSMFHQHLNLTKPNVHALLAIYPAPGLILDVFINYNMEPTIVDFVETYQVNE